jgi:hypothetical protein
MSNENLKRKLIRVDRSVVVYLVEKEKIYLEIPISDISLEELKSIVTPKEEDPFLYDGYELTENQLNRINDFLENKIVSDFKLYYYILECEGIYDWNKT